MPPHEALYLRMNCNRLEDRAGLGARAFGFAVRMGFEPRACWEIGIVVQELAANVVRHGGGGCLELYAYSGFLEIVATDAGPGISTQAMAGSEFWSRGLGAVRRLTNELEIKRAAPTGTRVTAKRYVERGS